MHGVLFVSSMQSCALLFVVVAIASVSANLEVSPCPRLFVYEDTKSYTDRWYGIITLLSDADLTGTWLRIKFDRPILQLGNWFGEVAKRGNTEYLIKNPTFKLKAHTPHILRFYVRYHGQPPALIGFRLNARVLCPEDPYTTTTTTTTERLFTSVDEESSSTTTEEPSSLFLSHHVDEAVDECGVSTVSTDESTQVAQPGEHPWHAALYYTKDITIAYLCGASLISARHVLTVAHCVVKGTTQRPVHPDRLIVYLGKYYLKHWMHEGTQTRYVEQVLPHPDYKTAGNRNDVAVLKMTKPSDYTELVRPVCLWGGVSTQTDVGTVVGWGFDQTGKIEETLMHVKMQVQERDACGNYTADDKAYCASFLEDTNECVGDSGGGMVVRTDSVYRLRGLVSVSVVLQKQLKCGPGQIVVFTDVAKYDDWIKDTMLL